VPIVQRLNSVVSAKRTIVSVW